MLKIFFAIRLSFFMLQYRLVNTNNSKIHKLWQDEVMGGFENWEFVVHHLKLIKRDILVYKNVHLLYTIEHLS